MEKQSANHGLDERRERRRESRTYERRHDFVDESPFQSISMGMNESKPRAHERLRNPIQPLSALFGLRLGDRHLPFDEAELRQNGEVARQIRPVEPHLRRNLGELA